MSPLHPVLETLLIAGAATLLDALLPRQRTTRPDLPEAASPTIPPAEPHRTAAPKPAAARTTPPPPPVPDAAPPHPPPAQTPDTPPPVLRSQAPTFEGAVLEAPLLMRAHGEDLELLYEQPVPSPPSGWITDTSGMVLWPANPHDRSVDAPTGTYLPIGGPGRSGQCFINLDRARLLSITGHPPAVRAISETTRGALRALANQQAIRLIELPPTGTGNPWHPITDLAASSRDHSVLVVFADSAPPPDLIAKALDPSGDLLIVTTASVKVGHQIRCDPDTVLLEPNGLAFPGITQASNNPLRPGCPHLPVPEDHLTIRLLGPIDTDPHLPLRAKALAVLAYLACQRTATGDQIERACWDSSRRTAKLRRNLIAELRNTIGAHRLPQATQDTYTLDPTVTTDLNTFEQHLNLAAQATDPTAKLDLLRCALSLVRGPVLTYPTRAAASFRWIDDLNLTSHWELQIERVALEVAQLAAQQQNPEHAIATLLHALRSLPHNTALTDHLLILYGETGQHERLQAAYNTHQLWLRDAIDADPEESTTAVVRHYLNSTLATTTAGGAGGAAT